MLMVLLQGL
jgi:hypothetical protein